MPPDRRDRRVGQRNFVREVEMKNGKQEWRCAGCGKLLGVHNGTRLHIRMEKGHEYLVGLPATATCRGCRQINEFHSKPNSLNAAS